MAGPSDNQPINPNLTDAVNKMASASEALASAATKIETSLDAAADSAGHLLKNLDMTKLADLVSIFDSVEESTKEIASYARKMRTGIFNTKNSADAVKYANQIVAAQKEMLKKTKENTLAWQAGSKSIEKMNGFIEKMGKRVGEMNQDELREFGKLMYEAEQSAEKLFKKFKDAKIGQAVRSIRGIESVIAPGAYAKGTAKRDKHLARQQQIQEGSQQRLAVGRASADDRRAKALSDMKRSGESVDLSSENVRKSLALKMGYRGKRASTFIAGEGTMAAGSTGGGEKYEKLMAHGGGGIGGGLSELASVVEALGSGLEGALAVFAPEIEVLAIVIGALVEAFDGFAKQNKEMESSIGKGGLFTQGGDAFGEARSRLNPKGGGYTQLGVTFERNLAIAGAMAAGGRNVGELVNGGPNIANKMSGSKGEFMEGPIGQVQRIAMGVGRVAGLTDVESVETVLKNLDQYGQTIEGTEKFFVQLNKDTKAAGISTTKYLQVIDEVSSHFDMMNKSLGETMGFLRQLGRTGAVSAETMKDLLGFMAGGPKADASNVAQRAYLEGKMGSGMAGARAGGEQENIEGMITSSLMPSLVNLLPANQIPEELKDPKKFATLSGSRRQGIIAALKDQIGHAVDASGNPVNQTAKTAANAALTALSRSSSKLDSYQRSGALNRAEAIGLTGDSLTGTTAMNLTRMKASGIPMSALVSGDFTGLSGTQMQLAQQLMKEVTGIDDPAQAQDRMRLVGQQMGGNRLDAAANDKGLAIQISRELWTQPKGARLWKQFAVEHKMKLTEANMDANAQKFLRESRDYQGDMAGQLIIQTGSLEGTRDWFVKTGSKIPKIMEQEQGQALKDARRIGHQTQGIEDAIKNAISIWMTKLVSGIEFMIDHWPWSGASEDKAALKKQYDDDSKQFVAINKTLEGAMGANRVARKDSQDQDEQDGLDAAYDKMKNVERHLADIKENGEYGSKEEAAQAARDKAYVLSLTGSQKTGIGVGDTYAVGHQYGQTPQEAADAARTGMSKPVGMMDVGSLLKAINTSTTDSRSTTTIFVGNANTHLIPSHSPNESTEKANSNPTTPQWNPL